MLRALPPVLLLALFPAACTVGDLTPIDDDGPGESSGDGDGDGDGDGSGDGSGGGGGDGSGGGGEESQPTVALSVAPGIGTSNLGQATEYTVSVMSVDYAGDVALLLENAPASWDVTFTPDVLAFTGSGALTSTLRVSIPANGESGSITTQVVGSATMGEQRGALALTVEDLYEVPLANNTGAGGAHAWPDVTINAGTTVRFTNYDTITSHTIHADGVIAHQDDVMAKAPAAGQAGGSYEILVTDTGNSVFYCHDHGANTGTGTLVSE